MLQMSVKVVGLDQSSMVPVVILTDADERFYLPVVIGLQRLMLLLWCWRV